MINLNLLTPFQLTTFVLAIVFSILSLATIFYTLKKPNAYKSDITKTIFVLVIPMMTYIFWFASVFAACGVFNSSELYIILLSIACGFALTLISIIIAYLIKKNKVNENIIEEETISQSDEIQNDENVGNNENEEIINEEIQEEDDEDENEDENEKIQEQDEITNEIEETTSDEVSNLESEKLNEESSDEIIEENVEIQDPIENTENAEEIKEESNENEEENEIK